MVVISIAIDPVNLQPLRDFGSEADLSRPKGGNYLELRWFQKAIAVTAAVSFSTTKT